MAICDFSHTVKLVLSGHSKIGEMKVLKTGGHLIRSKVWQNAPQYF